MNISKLHIYSLGTVAANKALDSKLIEVVPIEDTPMLNGELSDNLNTNSIKGKTANNSSYEVSIDSSVSIQATWLPIGISNRVTPPDVRRGETVVIYRFGDTDKYYWTTLQYDMKLRKLETVIFAISNTQLEKDTGSADNTYYLEMSTHRKVIHLHTSKSDGEPYTYDIQLNTKDGNFIFQDDIGNFISFDSKNIRLEMKNSNGSWIDMDKKIINVYAPDTINLKADNEINVTAGNSINHKTQHITTQAQQTDNTVPLTNTTGNYTIGGTLVVAMTTTTSGLISLSSSGSNSKGPIDGSVIRTATAEVQGDATFGGNVTVGGNVNAGGTGVFPGGVSAPNV